MGNKEIKSDQEGVDVLAIPVCKSREAHSYLGSFARKIAVRTSSSSGLPRCNCLI
jgi:hypothetical protein